MRKNKTCRVPKTKEPREVSLVSVERGSLPRTVTVSGTLAADEEVIASFKVSGRISEIAIDLGSTVNRNQVIARHPKVITPLVPAGLAYALRNVNTQADWIKVLTRDDL